MSASTKVYIAEARLGVSSDTLDSTGALVAQRPTDHVTQKKLLETLEKFKGEINQVPPLYSALSMDGKRLYDYAREGKPLPREIPSRKVQIYDLELLSFLPHRSSSASSTFEDTQLTSVYGFQPRSLPSLPPPSSASVPSMSSLGLKSGFQAKKHSDSVSNIPQDDDTSLYFHIRVHCSSGTYIRTLIADIATELGTVGHMTDLLRVEQSGFKLGEESTLEFSDCEDVSKINNAIQAGNLVWESQAGSDIKSSEPVSGSKYEMIDRGS
ncbi:hypothetical protein BGZ83_001477 [Gryganskiella cystojenkinii]|nr:hypothetical protein BGZ83_001477 [Gryganskiella cystojenkinii]